MPVPCGPAPRYFVGLDLGQAKDPSALVVLERPRLMHDTPAAHRRPLYQLRHIKRFHLGTRYPDVVSEVVTLLRTPPLHSGRPGPFLVVDATGVGRAVVDLLTDALRNKVTCEFQPITITFGQAINASMAGGLCVPKKDLVGVLQSLLQTGRLKIASQLREAALLVRELENFKVKITAAANETFEAWREGEHDDLVLATCLAAWVGERAIRAELTPPEKRPQLPVMPRAKPTETWRL